MGRRLAKALIASAAALAAQGAADVPDPGRTAVSAYGASIPERPYYPPGYRDLRIAAAAQVATFPRPRKYMVQRFDGERYDVVDCNAEYLGDESDPATALYGGLALDVARIGAELARLGYRREIFEEPLLAYEREVLASPAEAPEAAEVPAGAEADLADEPASDADAEGAWEPNAGRRLAAEMERRRVRLQPGKPKIVAESGCGAGETAFAIRTAPAGGRVWLVNAFAFHVCMTRVRDPWDLRACRWTEVDPDNATMASGRYMYQARWPDGKTARGARVFEGDFDSEAPTRITIRKN